MGATRASLSRVIKVSIFFILRNRLFKKSVYVFVKTPREIEDLFNCTTQKIVLIVHFKGLQIKINFD